MKLTQEQWKLVELIKFYHSGQKRKYTDEDYYTHPLAVAELVLPYQDEENMLVEIALLHDVLEDTSFKMEHIIDDLQQIIGYDLLSCRTIERGVIALTDVYTSERYDNLNRSARKNFEAYRLKTIHGDFQTVKYADLIHNTQSIVDHDKNFAKRYLQEKRYLLNLMRGGNLDLFVKCYQTLTEAEKQLNIKNI